MPLWPLEADDLTQGLKAQINSHNSSLDSLYLPARDFWVLTLDPDTPDSGIYASWDKNVELGTEFILLAKEELRSDINILKDEELLKWQTEENIFGLWYEYRGVTVLSEPEAWSSLSQVNEALRLTLQPRSLFSINLIGGLRAPRGLGWFVGYAPKISLAAFLPDAVLSIYNDNEECIFEKTVDAGQLIEGPFSQPGNYRLVVEQSGQFDEKIVRILDWEDIPLRLMEFEELANEFKIQIFGALVRG
jgi:hypothetical protein